MVVLALKVGISEIPTAIHHVLVRIHYHITIQQAYFHRYHLSTTRQMDQDPIVYTYRFQILKHSKVINCGALCLKNASPINLR